MSKKERKLWIVLMLIVAGINTYFAVGCALQSNWLGMFILLLLALISVVSAVNDYKRLKKLKADTIDPPRHHGGRHAS